MIVALGEKVFGALLAIAGAVIILTGHWATRNDMIGDLIAWNHAGVWRCGIIDVEISALNAAPCASMTRRLLCRLILFRGEPGRRAAAKLLTRDEACRHRGDRVLAETFC